MKRIIELSALMLIAGTVSAKTYYVSPITGKDTNLGISVEAPFKTLNRLEKVNLLPGDSILLHTDGVHKGVLKLVDVCGDKNKPVFVSAYDTYPGRRRVANIDASESVAGVYMDNCRYIQLSVG